MTNAPPPYPRTPHLWPPDSGQARFVLAPAEAERWLREPVVVEEKLDGANVSLWWDEGVQVASRGGPGSIDRAGQLGRLRAWAAARTEPLQELLADGWCAYGEWLWLRHTVTYEFLPDWLVVLDLWHADVGFAPRSDRDRRCRQLQLAVPPVLFEGTLVTSEAVKGLLGPSRFGSGLAEGIVLRDADGQRCKLVARGFQRRSDEDWSGPPVHNAIVDEAQRQEDHCESGSTS